MKIKRLDIFLLKTFFPVFIMTFGICLFVVLMNFLWKYVDEMVGKGIEIGMLAEEFFWATLTFVPMSLPIAILLASLMMFGNLGEQFELLAIKSSGISLLRIMRPLIVFLCVTAVGIFYFQDHIIPYSQVKMWTLLYSIRQKSPELDIPENTFYSEISGFNLHVKKKDKTGLLKELRIYDYNGGFNNLEVTVADSGRLKMSADKLFLILTLHNGEVFSNLNKNQTNEDPTKAVPYRKESFKMKEILIKYDANFNMQSEAIWQDRHIGKNLSELRQSIDSMTLRIDSIKYHNSLQIFAQSYKKTFSDSTLHQPKIREIPDRKVDFHQIYRDKKQSEQLLLLGQVKTTIEGVQNDYGFRSNVLASEERKMRQHHTEMHQKFALSFACLIFFFIGAPLGAIIRKGGLGLPTVISVALFICYHILSNIGLKMSVNGMWQPWQGMWLSSAVLLPLGIFLTYKATNDSAILNVSILIERLKKIAGIRSIRKIEKKEIILFDIDYLLFNAHIDELEHACRQYLQQNKRWIPYFTFWKQVGKEPNAVALSYQIEKLIEEGRDSDKNIILNKLMDFPILDGYRFNLRMNERTGEIIGYIFPISIFFYLFSMYKRKFFIRDIQFIQQTCNELLEIMRKL
jgi:Predicted permeases